MHHIRSCYISTYLLFHKQSLIYVIYIPTLTNCISVIFLLTQHYRSVQFSLYLSLQLLLWPSLYDITFILLNNQLICSSARTLCLVLHYYLVALFQYNFTLFFMAITFFCLLHSLRRPAYLPPAHLWPWGTFGWRGEGRDGGRKGVAVTHTGSNMRGYSVPSTPPFTLTLSLSVLTLTPHDGFSFSRSPSPSPPLPLALLHLLFLLSFTPIVLQVFLLLYLLPLNLTIYRSSFLSVTKVSILPSSSFSYSCSLC